MWHTIITNIILFMFAIITPAAAFIGNGVVKRISSRWRMDSALKYDNKIDELILKGIKAVEQKSMVLAANGQDVIPGSKKLDQAVKFVNSQLVDMKLPQKSENELSMLVDAHLFDGAKAKIVSGIVIAKPDQSVADRMARIKKS